MRLSSFARVAATGAAVGGAAYVPLATLGSQSAGATPGFGSLRVVLTSDPAYYIYTKDATCAIFAPFGHESHQWKCVYREAT